jgi:hypothetical protein
MFMQSKAARSGLEGADCYIEESGCTPNHKALGCGGSEKKNPRDWCRTTGEDQKCFTNNIMPGVEMERFSLPQALNPGSWMLF